jgi:hypothetical protein
MLLVRYMDKLRERYPEESSEWVRKRAEALVEKLGDAAGLVASTSRASSSSTPPQEDGLIAARVVGWIAFVGAIVCFLGFVLSKADVIRFADGSAVRQNVAEIIATQWLIASGMCGVIWVGVNLTAFLSRALVNARDAIVAAIERSSQ